MAFLNPIVYMANRGGIPRIASTGAVVGTANVTFNFEANALFSNSFSGLVLVKVMQTLPDDTTGTLPIVFSSAAGTQAVTKYNGQPLTVADVMGTGIYLCYYDRASGVLQVMTGIA